MTSLRWLQRSMFSQLLKKNREVFNGCIHNRDDLGTHESRNFGDVTPERGTTRKLKISKFTDFDKQTQGLLTLLSSNLALLLGLSYSFTVIFPIFVENLKTIQKTSVSNCRSNTPLDEKTVCSRQLKYLQDVTNCHWSHHRRSWKFH